MPKTSYDFVFFCDVIHNLKKRLFLHFVNFYILANLLGNERPLFVTCDWWIAIRFVCFCVSRVVALFLKSTVGLILVLSFVNFFTLKRDKFRFQRWNFSYRAFISRGNTDTEGSKRTDTFPLTFKFADKHSGYYGNSLIDVTEKFKFGACSIWIVEDVGRGFYLFSTYLGRLKETLFTG